jgi:hypothetical protein
MYKKQILLSLTLVILGSLSNVYSQISVDELSGKTNNPVESAVPFLTISPDSRAGAMGDAGVATSPDVNSLHWNPAKYAFIDNEMGFAFSYTPWLRNLVGDIDLAYLTGYKRIDKFQTVAASLLYFALGDIDFTDRNGEFLKTAKPNEFAIDVAYARAFSQKFSGGLAFRFIHSDLSNGMSVNGTATSAGNAFAADISAYYNTALTISEYNSKLAFGIDISNIGNKMTYNQNEMNKDFLPMNFRLGGALTMDINEYNSFTFTTDINKLLVPTNPVKSGDSILYGKDTDVPVVVAIFQSFWDAPGVPGKDGKRSVFKEEMREFTYSLGVEYWYRKQFAIRSGYFHEAETKGNRKYFTVGLGLKLNVIGFDFSYLIPQKANNPLANTLRFTLSLDFDAFRKMKKNKE